MKDSFDTKWKGRRKIKTKLGKMSCELLYENTGIHAITTNERYFKCLGFNVILTEYESLTNFFSALKLTLSLKKLVHLH